MDEDVFVSLNRPTPRRDFTSRIRPKLLSFVVLKQVFEISCFNLNIFECTFGSTSAVNLYINEYVYI